MLSAYRQLRFRIIGASPLLMHNGQLADPLNEHAIGIAQVASRRRKTEADHRRLAELEFLGSLYLSGGKPCIPAEAMEAALVKAAAQERRGPKARAGLLVRDDLIIEHEGPLDPAKLFYDDDYKLRCAVRVGTSRVMRTRPRFKQWAADITVEYLPGMLNAQDVRSFVVTAGEQIGIGAWRPRFGRFWLETPI